MHPSGWLAKSGISRTHSILKLFAALLFVAGCGGTSCFVGIINPPNGSLQVTTGSPPPACSLAMTPAAVSVVAQMAAACTNCSNSLQVSQVSLWVSGIEFHSSVIADENSADWQQLAPDLASNPQHVDLVADPISHKFMLPLSVAGHVSTGTYYQVRVRLAERSSVVSADGGTHALQTGNNSYVHVELTAPFDVTSGGRNELHIELQTEWGLAKTSTGSIEAALQLRGQGSSENTASLAN